MLRNKFLVLLGIISLNFCVFGQAEVLVNTDFGPYGLDIKDDYLYVAAGYLYKVDITQESPVLDRLIDSARNPDDVLINEDFLYYSEYGVRLGEGGIYKVDLTETIPTSELIISNLERPRGLAIKGNYLYFNYWTSSGAGAGLYRIDLTETNPVATAIVTGFQAIGLALKDDILYLADFLNGNIFKLDISAPPYTLINLNVTGMGQPRGLEFRGDDLYISSFTLDKIVKININEADPIAEDVYLDVIQPYGMVFSGDDMYFTEYSFTDDGRKRLLKLNLNTLGVEQSETLETIIYPNPTTDFIHIKTNKEHINYRIFDINGKTLLDGVFNQNNPLNVERLDSGIYFIELDNSVVKKIIKT